MDSLDGLFDDVDLLRLRAVVMRSVREFLFSHNHLEVHSPILSSQLIPERHIEVYSVEEDERLFLTPSPEIHLKQMLSRFSPRVLSQLAGIYEVTHSFRKQEQKSPMHEREFLLLEYYSLQKDTGELRDFTYAMIQYVIQALLSYKKQGAARKPLSAQEHAPKHEQEHAPKHAALRNLQRAAVEMSLHSAFEQYSSLDFMKFVNSKTTEEAREHSGIDRGRNDLEWEDMFHYLVLQHVEPALPKDVLVFLHDYPSRLPTLAKKREGTPWSCRWELYINGVEIANCYEEETDATVIRQFIRDEMQAKGIRTNKAPCNLDFLSTHRLPRCSGVALGLDRLFLSLMGADSLKECSTMRSDILDI